MLIWYLSLFVMAVLAAVFGFGDIATDATIYAKTLFFIVLSLFAITFFTNLIRGKRNRVYH